LKPSHILFDESHRIPIVDIILNWAELHSRENFDESTRKANGIPSEFAAPEGLSGRKLTQKADVFALASILFSIVVGHRPFRKTAERSGRSSSVMLEMFFIKTAKERIANQCIAEIVNDGERYGAAQKGSRKRTFQASNWNIVSRMPSRPKPIQRVRIAIVQISFDEELRRQREY
jgi:hypothetical protein